MKLILVADIGGTNSRFAVLDNDLTVWQVTISTNSVTSFSELLFKIKEQIKEMNISSAVFAIAGPVLDSEVVNAPNIIWQINKVEIEKILGIKKSKLINDFQAQALSVLALESDSFFEVRKGQPSSAYPRAVIGAGTGFGKALLIKYTEDRYISLASEGGHNDFVATDEIEFKFRVFAINKYKQKNLFWDDVLSGRGLETLCEFLYSEQLSAEKIAEKYLNYESEILQMFAKFYARAARCFVLDTLALDGLYLAGGVAGKNPLIVNSNSFIDSFLDSKYREILANVPIFLIKSSDSGLKGAAYEAYRIIN